MDLGDNSKIKRARATNWPTVMSKFVLDWYLQKKKEMPPKTKFKKMHHHYCTTVLNARFETTFTVDQVHRHFRRFKEVWNIVARYMNMSGSRFDKKHKMLILPPSTLASLPIAERAILVKPIPFFDHIQALFGEWSVDAAPVTDPIEAADINDDDMEILDPLNMMANCADARDPDGADLDKFVLEDEDDCHEVAASSDAVPCEVMSDTSAPSAQPSGSFAESTMAALKPGLKKCKVVSRTKTTPNPKPQAPVPHDGRKADMVKSTLAGIHDTPAKPIRAAPTSSDPNAPLWNMLKEIPLTPADRLSVGICLCKPEFEVHRSFFMNMGREYLEAWAHKFLSGGEPGSL
ncbi:Os05g0182900 [Oryza sativa Japonica Group]|nr:Os05g0182900 [Oryza sativa Japonica Group]|eukprot:NP_001054823.1 Os05g0182900 [Oryza sativa Japonica Group]